MMATPVLPLLQLLVDGLADWPEEAWPPQLHHQSAWKPWELVPYMVDSLCVVQSVLLVQWQAQV